jgi:hypothetical protein
MKNVLRAYTINPKSGIEECTREPEQIVKILSNIVKAVDLDWANERGHVIMGTSADLIGETVKIGEYEIPIGKH